MKFNPPGEFLDLCERLKTTEPDFALARKIIPDQLVLGNPFRDSCGRVFEFLVRHTVTQLAKDYGALPLQKADEPLLAPYSLDLRGQCYLVLNRQYAAELDCALRFGENQLWVLAAKTGWRYKQRNKPLLKEEHLSVFTDIAQNGAKLSYAFITTRDMYNARFGASNWGARERIAEYNIVATYLIITHEHLMEFTENLIQDRMKR